MTEISYGSLQILDPRGEPSNHPLMRKRYTLGRSGADILLDDKKASRIHAELYCDPFGRWWIHDLQSRNGTWVNGQRIVEHPIQSQDSIVIGACMLRWAMGAVPAEGPTYAAIDDDWALDTQYEHLDQMHSLVDMKSSRLGLEDIRRMADFSEDLVNAESTQKRLHLLCRMVLGDPFHAKSAVVIRLDSSEEDSPLISLYEAGVIEENRVLSRSLIQAVLDRNEIAMSCNVLPEYSDVSISSSGEQNPATAIACPLDQAGTVRRILYIILPPVLTSGEWMAMLELSAILFRQADATALAREKAVAHAIIERDLQEAQGLQQRLVPQVVNFHHLEVGMIFKPCRWVAGDYLDIIETSDHRVFMVMADVCGKGMQAALITTSLHAVLHSQITDDCQLIEVVDGLNRYLCNSLQDRSFVTMLLIEIDTTQGIMKMVNAGHPPALILNQQGEFSVMPEANHPPLGILPEDFKATEYELPEEAILLLYTDGITEMSLASGRRLDQSGMETIVKNSYKDCHEYSLETMAQTIDRRLEQLAPVGPAEDDRTLLLARWSRASEETVIMGD